MKRDWYIQEAPLALFYTYPVCESIISSMPKKSEFVIKTLACSGEKNIGHYMLDKKESFEVAQRLIQTAKDKKAKEKLIADWQKDVKIFEDCLERLDKIDLRRESNARVLELFEEFYQKYIDEYSIPLILDAFSIYAEDHLHNRLRKKLAELNRDEDFNRLFTTLTTCTENSFFLEEKIGLLKILKEIEKENLIGLFQEKETREILECLKENKKIMGLLKEQRKGFHWIHNNYFEVKELKEVFFLGELKELIKNRERAEEELKNISKEKKLVKVEKEKILKELKFGSDFKSLVELIDEFAFWADNRKKYNLIADYYIYQFLKEASRRSHLPVSLLRNMHPQQLPKALEGKVDVKDLKEKEEAYLFLLEGGKVRLFQGRQAKEKIKNLQKLDINKQTNEIRGKCGSLGLVTGKVKIIRSASEIDKLNEGEILVTSMTRPEFVPAMKKAGGIITDEGGVTCHAAIISRELKKPCVIATKIATKVLKDNEMVEIRAHHGLIKRLDF